MLNSQLASMPKDVPTTPVSRLTSLTEFVKRPQVGAKGLMWVKVEQDGAFKSSVGKFFTPEDLAKWAERMEAERATSSS